MSEKLIRMEWWPGVPPTIKTRVMCSDCRFHDPVPAGWQWDRCNNPQADYGSVVRNDQRATCVDMRYSEDQCGFGARWFEAKAK